MSSSEMEAATSNETKTSNGVGSPSMTSSSSVKEPLLYLQYPVGSTWDFTLSTDERIAGATVYCTDEVSDTVMIQKALAHTTLATEVRILQSSHIVQATKAAETTGSSSRAVGGESSVEASSFLFQPLPKIQKKALEERERRAIRLAEDSFRHINQKVRHFFFFRMDMLHLRCDPGSSKTETLVYHQGHLSHSLGMVLCRIFLALYIFTHIYLGLSRRTSGI